jgi:hypothetical protein
VLHDGRHRAVGEKEGWGCVEVAGLEVSRRCGAGLAGVVGGGSGVKGRRDIGA